jgi:hypothetical protein
MLAARNAAQEARQGDPHPPARKIPARKSCRHTRRRRKGLSPAIRRRKGLSPAIPGRVASRLIGSRGRRSRAGGEGPSAGAGAEVFPT